MTTYFKIEIPVTSSQESELLLSELAEINFYAFEEEPNHLIAYIKEEDFSEEAFVEILSPRSIFKRLIIEEENWNTQWESSIEPVIINDFAVVRPSFHPVVKDVKHDLIITPKMSFGTGHHATTFLMIEAMEKIDFTNKEVIDFGTGTGVLAILAEKCGASKIMAVDYDEWSISNASENIKANNCKNIEVLQKNNVEGLSNADIILANINLNVLKEAAHSLSLLLSAGALLLTSGFLEKDEEEMQNIFAKENVSFKHISRSNGWAAILFQKGI